MAGRQYYGSIAAMSDLSWEAVEAFISSLYTGTAFAGTGFIAFTANHSKIGLNI